MRLGLVGVGNMGRNHLRVIRENVDLEEDVVVYDPNLRGSISYEKFLTKCKDLDGVSICSPSHTHVDIATDILEKNSDIKLLIEKPIDTDPKKVSSLEPFKRQIMVGHIERFNPAVIALKKMIHTGLIKQIYSIRTRRNNNVTSREMTSISKDLLVHDYDVCCYLTGKRSVAGTLLEQSTHSDGRVDYAELCTKFEGFLSSCTANWFSPIKIRDLTCHTSQGIVHLDYIRQTLSITDLQGNLNVLDEFVRKGEPLAAEINYFCAMINENLDPLCDIDDALHSLSVVGGYNENIHLV
jgi:UDP-N-acetylglucosamine 3-dehydrogenase